MTVFAGVAELVDAMDSKSIVRKDVRVRVSPSAHLMKSKIIGIVGPTASGKSDLAVKLARKFNCEIVSADSRQVYKGLNVGTGKITEKEMQGVCHYLLDVANPKKKLTVTQFKKLGERAIRNIEKKNKLPIICGGTGFYVDTLLRGAEFPEVPPNPALRKKLEKLSTRELFNMLKKLDLRRSSEIDKSNPRRLTRAIEISTKLGKVPTIKNIETRYDILWIGIKPKKEILKKRIHARLLSRLRQGMIEEAKRLRKDGVSFKRMEELGLEYKYLSYFLQNKIDLKEFETSLEKEIYKYAKRQMTWFKRYKDIIWFDSSTGTNKMKIENTVKNFI